MKIPKSYDLLMLFFVVLLQIGSAALLVFTMQGCAGKQEPTIIDSVLYDQRPAIKMIIVEKPPARVTYVGSITGDSINMTDMILKHVDKYKYHNYKFNPVYRFNMETRSYINDTQKDNASWQTNQRKKKK
jgi:hypothetical protein